MREESPSLSKASLWETALVNSNQKHHFSTDMRSPKWQESFIQALQSPCHPGAAGPRGESEMK